MGSLKCVPMFFRGAGEGGKENGFSWVHSALGLQTGEGPLLCRQRPSVCASGRLGVRPIRVVITTCYWSTQCTSVFPQCPSWLLVTTGTSEWGLWQETSYRTLHLTGCPRAATPCDWPPCSVTKGDHKGPVQRRREKGNQGLRFIWFKVYKLLWGGKPTLITKFTWHFPNKKEFVTRATFFPP